MRITVSRGSKTDNLSTEPAKSVEQLIALGLVDPEDQPTGRAGSVDIDD